VITQKGTNVYLPTKLCAVVLGTEKLE